MTPEQTVANIPLKDIFADDTFNCRGVISPLDVVDLVKDIELQGLIQPVTVAPYGRDGFKWLLMAGFRRYMAHRVMGRETILALCRQAPLKDIDARYLNLTENLRRKDLTIMQEARALKGIFVSGASEKEASMRLGQSISWIRERFMLLKLPEMVQKEVESGMVPKREIRNLYTIHMAGKAALDGSLLVNAVKRIKDAKIRGGESAIARKILPHSTKHTKKRWQPPEIFKMMSHIQQHLGNGLYTRALAWSAGTVSSEELFQDIAKECALSNVAYTIPSEGEWNAV